MKIEYRITGSGPANWTTLADEAVVDLAARISGYQPKLRKSPQVEQLPFSEQIFIQDRGNGQWDLGFAVERLHGSPDAALDFLALHPVIFAGDENFDLKITVGAKIVYMESCAVTEFTPDPHSDQSTICRYAYTGGSYSNEALA